jgi:hypothetical protein
VAPKDHSGVAKGTHEANRARNAEAGKSSNVSKADHHQVNRLQVNDRQRRNVRAHLLKGRVDRVRNHRDFTLTVGSRIPRHHRRHLHRITAAIFAIAPLYRDYDYIVVEDTICIVDPETYTIVDVIPASIERAEAPVPALSLSSTQMRFVYANVPKDSARADVRARLALGNHLPRRVDTFPFPDDVVANIPELESYEYVVVDTDVVIVNPRNHEIALIIPE